MAKSGRGARVKGHQFERWFVLKLRGLGYIAETSRFASKKLDDMKVDILTDCPFLFQLKSLERLTVAPHELLKSMPNNKPPVILHKRSNKGVVVSML